MTDDLHQIDIPQSFIALYVDPGRTRPNAPRAVIGARYEFCEDLACLLTEHARTMLFDLGVTEDDVLERCHRGLAAGDAGVSGPEAGWVVCRLAELLQWPMWQPPAAEPADDSHS